MYQATCPVLDFKNSSPSKYQYQKKKPNYYLTLLQESSIKLNVAAGNLLTSKL